MTQKTINLLGVDELKITTVMDNNIDLLLGSNQVAKRLMPRNANPMDEEKQPIAQHGFSVLIKARQGEKQGSVLFDTGVSRRGILYNMDVMEINPADFQAIVLSHGHPDHAMGLEGLVDRLGHRSMPLVLHPEAFLERKVSLPNGFEMFLPPPKKEDLRRENIEIIEEVGPSLLVNDIVLISGEVTRTTNFEIGLSFHYAKKAGQWVPDPFLPDDQCAIINVRDRGLVIITGCGHSGIINIIRNAQALTGVEKIYAVIGGFHLPGEMHNPAIAPTVAALQQIGPQYLMPGHCTGWFAIHQIATALPQSFIANSVGTTLVL